MKSEWKLSDRLWEEASECKECGKVLDHFWSKPGKVCRQCGAVEKGFITVALRRVCEEKQTFFGEKTRNWRKEVKYKDGTTREIGKKVEDGTS